MSLRLQPTALGELGARVAAAVAGGARVGETAVVSTQVHTLDPRRPGSVAVVVDRDAGQVFYGRRRPGEVLHLDVFHAVGDLDCRAAAAAVAAALAAFRRDRAGAAPWTVADYYDVQTGTGGGCVAGSLTGGRRPSLRRAHRNHVHVAGRYVPDDAAVVFYLVDALERAIAAAGLEIRRVEELRCERAGEGGGWADLSPYASEGDTHLREDAGGGPPAAGGAAAGAPHDALLVAAAQLADELGGVGALGELLQSVAPGVSLHELRAPGWNGTRLREALLRLQRDGWVECVAGRFRLTERGRALGDLFRHHLREIELALRSAARRVAVSAAQGIAGARPRGLPGVRGSGRRVQPRSPGQPLAELAVTETVVAACRRQAPRPGRPVCLHPDDLHVARRLRPRRVDLCLLLDASASMEGGRMRAAKTLARHLLLTSRDRVAVMAFQERAAHLAVPFTRNYAAAERGLARIVPAGLTPLAAGLAAARSYLLASHAKNPLLLLVTDGIPTVSAGGGSPLEEALQEAAALRGTGVSLCCIGLEPNERYLAELARRAGGSLHVVAELRPEVLAHVAQRERARLGAEWRRERARKTVDVAP